MFQHANANANTNANAKANANSSANANVDAKIASHTKLKCNCVCVCRYAHAKRMIDVLNKSYATQNGRCFTSVVPTNIYGPADNFHLEDAHVVPALIHKCSLAKQAGTTHNNNNNT